MTTPTALGPLEKTSRGFEIVNFKETNGEECSIQQSSSAEDDLIWLGIVDANPQVLASKAHLYGVYTLQTEGWVKYPVPEGVLMTTRMHLNKVQVQNLIAVLTCWLNSGSFHDPDLIPGPGLHSNDQR